MPSHKNHTKGKMPTKMQGGHMMPNMPPKGMMKGAPPVKVAKRAKRNQRMKP